MMRVIVAMKLPEADEGTRIRRPPKWPRVQGEKLRPAGGDRQRTEYYALAKLQSEAVRKIPGGLVF
jgi:hypothetical protein